jgi:integrase
MPATYRQRGPHSFEVVIRAGQAREYKNVKTARDARELVRIVNDQERRGVPVVATIQQHHAAPASQWPRLRDALPEFIDAMEARGDWTGSTPSGYRRRLATHVYNASLEDGRLVGDLPVDHVTAPIIGGILDRLRSRGLGGQPGKSLAVQNQIRSPLVAYFRELMVKQGFAGPNPALDLKLYMSKTPSRRALQGRTEHFAHEEVAQLFGTAAALVPRWRTFLAVQILAGLRYGEAAALERTDIDFRKGLLHVRRSWSDRIGQVKDVKDHEDRYVPLAALGGERLAGWLRAQLEAITLEGQVGEWSVAQRQLVFPNLAGRPQWHSSFLELVWQPLLEKAGLPYRKIHAMRHTFGTWAADAGVPIHQLAAWMGHASIKETERYLHADQARITRSIDVLDGLMP